MYENMTRIELEARLHFFEVNAGYTVSELRKANERIEKLSVENKQLSEQNKEFKAELDRVNEILKLAKDSLFGRKTERYEIIPDGQLSWFDDEQTDNTKEQPKKLVKAHYRATKRTIEQIYGSLPSDKQFYYLSEEDIICKRCGCEMHKMGFDCHTEIEYIPAVYRVLEIYKEKCVCKKCEHTLSENGEEKPVFALAEGPCALIKHSMVSPSLAANEINAKICLRLPLYCMEQEYARRGIYRSRETMCNNMLALAQKIEPIYDLMIQELVTLEIIHADETPLAGQSPQGQTWNNKGLLLGICFGKI
ncbi:transposase [Ruminococcus sp. YE78]|uniref:IS66 family transposase n=1 Tax=Ruminococcus sp. YE78 TaxID=1352374 RepID=UPI00088F849C|nr:transposase [Ruminococcus sp. YE78]SDA32923.1 zinc-finger binding domain of transposase IS66 [Ruminococcus sp. YE78]